MTPTGDNPRLRQCGIRLGAVGASAREIEIAVPRIALAAEPESHRADRLLYNEDDAMRLWVTMLRPVWALEWNGLFTGRRQVHPTSEVHRWRQPERGAARTAGPAARSSSDDQCHRAATPRGGRGTPALALRAGARAGGSWTPPAPLKLKGRAPRWRSGPCHILSQVPGPNNPGSGS